MNSCKPILILLAVLAMFSDCGWEGTASRPEVKGTSMDNIPAAAWDKLARKRIFFGHQSVGNNIMEGMEALLKGDPSKRLTIVETADPSRFDSPVFAHARVGKNADPASKCDAFERDMDSGIGNRADIAFFKFCYVDFDRNTDIGKVFETYKATVQRVKMKYPGLTLVHVTVPLTSIDDSLKVRMKIFVKGIMGRKHENVVRHELNERIRMEYKGKAPVFDLAAIESTSPAGEPVSFIYKGKEYPCMYSGHTTDGGHLNEAGKRFVAGRLLSFLAESSEDGK